MTVWFPVIPEHQELPSMQEQQTGIDGFDVGRREQDTPVRLGHLRAKLDKGPGISEVLYDLQCHSYISPTTMRVDEMLNFHGVIQVQAVTLNSWHTALHHFAIQRMNEIPGF